MAATLTNIQTARLRSECLAAAADPAARLSAGRRLLKIAASKRNIVAVRKLLSAFESSDPKIIRRAQRLQAQLERAVDQVRELAEANQATRTTSTSVVGNIHLLPPDETDDPFWDSNGEGLSRRERLAIVWNFPDDASRDQIVAAILSDPARLEAHVVKRQIWACSTAELDTRFAQDTEELNRILAARGARWCDAELDRLADSLSSPFIEFSVDANDSDLPQLKLTAAGNLRDNIEFVKLWPSLRVKYQPL